MKKIFYCTILLSLLLAGCNKYNYDEVDNRLTGLDLSELSFTDKGGSKTIEVPGNAGVSATSSSSWCTVTVSGNQVTVKADTNHTQPNRTAILTINSGGKSVFVPVTQSGNRFVLSTANLPAGCFEGTYKVAVQSTNPVSVASASSWITDVTLVGDTISFSVSRNPGGSPAREGTVEVTSGDITQKLTVTQPFGLFLYEEFLGTYTMKYTTSNNSSAINRSRTATVTLEQAEQGETYYLKGILAPADEALGNIVVNYNEEKGLEVLGQILFKRSGTNYDFWWLPYSNSANGNWVNRSTAVGMVSTEFSSSGNLTFSMIDNGAWGTQVLAGFLLRNYNGSANMGNINGRDGQAFIFFPLFEKQ